MNKNKNNQTIWNARIKKNTSTIFQKVGSSISIDKKLYKEDIAGSIAHVEMLFRQKIISFKIKNKIIYGLNKIEKEIIKKVNKNTLAVFMTHAQGFNGLTSKLISFLNILIKYSFSILSIRLSLRISLAVFLMLQEKTL